MSSIKPYVDRFDALQTRERLLVVLVLAALIYLLWGVIFGNAVDADTRQLNRTVTDANTQLETQKIELASLKLRQTQDPDLALRHEVEQLSADITSLDKELAAMSVGLVPAQELPLILEQVLVKTGQLKLLRLATLPIEELQLTALSDADDASPATGVYRHAVTLTLNGEYFALNDYLQALEQLPWRFYWDSLSYSVTSYPKAEITLRVYTLSTERGAIGG